MFTRAIMSLACSQFDVIPAAGENGRQDEEDGHASPTRLPEQPDGFIEPRNISRLAETVVKVHSTQRRCLAASEDLMRSNVMQQTGRGYVRSHPYGPAGLFAEP